MGGTCIQEEKIKTSREKNLILENQHYRNVKLYVDFCIHTTKTRPLSNLDLKSGRQMQVTPS